MRLAIAGCVLAIALVSAVFGFFIVTKSQIPSFQIAAVGSAPAPAQTTQIPRTIVEVPTPADRSAEPAQTVAQRSAEVAVAQAPPAIASNVPTIPASAVPTAAPPPLAPPAPAASSCANPNALGIARTVEIDTTGGPGFGFEHFKEHDFLRPGEVVLTFDDGPWPRNTQAVLAALATHCTRAIFFPIGKHATYEPGLLKQVAAAGHSIGSHTWSHANLAKKGMTVDEAKAEIEKGISAVAWAVGGPVAPYFRFPALQHPPELVTYLGERNIGIFSTDFDSFDFRMRRPEQVRKAVMDKLKKHGKGMALMHDFQQATAQAVADLLDDLKANGYRIVHMRPKFAVTTLPAYDEAIRSERALPTVSQRPTSSVVRTVSE
jgi:peptidoglycan/xylan/chitin deacetylase (PgdA/CDA1 family)